jgi:hypothetical protein
MSQVTDIAGKASAAYGVESMLKASASVEVPCVHSKAREFGGNSLTLGAQPLMARGIPPLSQFAFGQSLRRRHETKSVHGDRISYHSAITHDNMA